MTICFGEPNLDGDDDATADVDEDDDTEHPDHHHHGTDSMTSRFAQWYFALMSPPSDKGPSTASSSSSSSSSSHGTQYGGGGTSSNSHHNNHSPSTTQLASTMAVVVPSLSHGAGSGSGLGSGLGSSPGGTGTGTPIGSARELTGEYRVQQFVQITTPLHTYSHSSLKLSHISIPLSSHTPYHIPVHTFTFSTTLFCTSVFLYIFVSRGGSTGRAFVLQHQGMRGRHHGNLRPGRLQVG